MCAQLQSSSLDHTKVLVQKNCCCLKKYPQLDDDSNAITLSNNLAAKTTWTLLIYLSTCVGGETVFYPETLPSKSKQKIQSEIVVQPEIGMALLHKHGQECLLHEGRVVEDGEKWVIRSDLCVKR